MEEGKAYIESGILELYVLGQLGPKEQAEVEAMAVQYPEIRKEIAAVELALEQYAARNGIEPAEGLEDKILNAIALINEAEVHTDKGDSPLPVLDEVNAIPINSYESKIRTLKLSLAACIAFLVISLLALLSVHNRLGSAKVQIAQLTMEKEQFTNTVGYMRRANSELQKIADMSADPDWKVIKLAGTKMNPKASMMVYWNAAGRQVMMDNRKMHLPANDQDHQYQLWALVNGKPVDLGVFDVDSQHDQILINMRAIASAQTFAVTVEKRGGSLSPTLDQMIVAGNVSI